MPMKEDPGQNFNFTECNCNPLSNKIHSFIIYYDYSPIVLPYFFRPSMDFPAFVGGL